MLALAAGACSSGGGGRDALKRSKDSSFANSKAT